MPPLLNESASWAVRSLQRFESTCSTWDERGDLRLEFAATTLAAVRQPSHVGGWGGAAGSVNYRGWHSEVTINYRLLAIVIVERMKRRLRCLESRATLQSLMISPTQSAEQNFIFDWSRRFFRIGRACSDMKAFFCFTTLWNMADDIAISNGFPCMAQHKSRLRRQYRLPDYNPFVCKPRESHLRYGTPVTASVIC
jgi:hypothetical protein